jgi:ComF family protein
MLDWVYPPVCVSCRSLLPLGKSERYLCILCRDLFVPLAEQELDVSGKYFQAAYATYAYEGLMRELLLQMKFSPKKAAAHAMGELLAKQSLPAPQIQDTILVPLPMHPKKQRERGFNQAEILAYYIGKEHGIPVLSALIRTEDTPPQAGLHPKLRTENVKGVFSIAAGISVRAKHFTIIDDIYTTGASANEAADVLMANGAASVHVYALSVSLKS